MTTVDQRRTQRVAVELPCTLVRRRGNAVLATTQNLGVGGMCVVTDRPLSPDEEFEFDLAPEAPDHLQGRALVVRQQAHNCYALRFDQRIDGIVEWAAAH